MDLAKNFIQLRTLKGLSVYKLSKLSDVSENYIHKIEKGESLPSVFVLEKLLKCLDITLSEFFCEDSTIMYLTSCEREALQLLRALDSQQEQVVLDLLRVMGKNQENGKKREN